MAMMKATHRGMLHKELGVPEGETISVGALMRKKAKDKKKRPGKMMNQEKGDCE